MVTEQWSVWRADENGDKGPWSYPHCHHEAFGGPHEIIWGKPWEKTAVTKPQSPDGTPTESPPVDTSLREKPGELPGSTPSLPLAPGEGKPGMLLPPRKPGQ
jgi:hypothetical protein